MAARLPTTQERAAIIVEANKGNDNALPVKDRRGRANISDATRIPPLTTVYIGPVDEYVMLGPGRGEGWALLAWIDEDGNRCFGTFHESQFTLTKPTSRADETQPVTGGGRS